jgi:hypothetical protein
VALALAIAVWAGCGPAEPPFTDNSQDPLAYARDVKAQILSAARQAKTSSEPVDFLDPVLVELKRTDRPLGDSRAVYDDLRTRVEQLVADCKRAGRAAPNLSGRLDELVRVAQTLPGESADARSN